MEKGKEAGGGGGVFIDYIPSFFFGVHGSLVRHQTTVQYVPLLLSPASFLRCRFRLSIDSKKKKLYLHRLGRYRR